MKKKILIGIAIALALWFVISNPIGASSAVNGGFDNLGDAGDSLSQFATNLFQ